MTGTSRGQPGAGGDLLRRFLSMARLEGLGSKVGILMGGTVLAQAIPIAASPILTRLYGPTDFGTFAVYLTAFSVLATVACLRLELAICIPKDEGDAFHVLVLALGASLLVGSGAAALAWAFGPTLVPIAGAEALRSHLWVLPLALVATGTYQAHVYWALRHERLKSIAAMAVGQSVGQGTTQVALGIAGAGPQGLILGDAIGRLGASCAIAFATHRRNGAGRIRVSLRQLAEVGRRFRSFPLLSGTSGLVNTAGLWAPAAGLSALYGPDVAGLYMLCQRVGALPAAVLGQAVSQVYYSEATRLAATDPGALHAHFRRVAWRLLQLGALPLAALALVGPFLVQIVFGARWEEAGHYLRILAPMLLAQFVVAPLSFATSVLERQGVQLAWDVARLAAVALAIWSAKLSGMSARGAVALYGLASLAAYGTLYLVCDRLMTARSAIIAPE